MPTQRKIDTLFYLIISLLLISLFVMPCFAVSKARESELNGGWQIWIEAADFDNRDDNEIIKLSDEVPDLAANATEALTEKFIIAPGPQKEGFNDYNFESPYEGKAYIYCHVMDYRGGGQSWWITLNLEEGAEMNDDNFAKISTPGSWEWRTRDFQWELKQGTNTATIVPREAAEGMELLMDVFVVSTVEFEPTDDDFLNATASVTAVQPEDKLATNWASIKNDF